PEVGSPLSSSRSSSIRSMTSRESITLSCLLNLLMVVAPCVCGVWLVPEQTIRAACIRHADQTSGSGGQVSEQHPLSGRPVFDIGQLNQGLDSVRAQADECHGLPKPIDALSLENGQRGDVSLLVCVAVVVSVPEPQ